ncbi:MAG TPA: RsmB/NOP family class I SAM-dependent RNA methyltransferase [Methanothrix sp.]|nr:RsmB/NOP family class I SAM-dependent RNA methyltransferase [Methanothrix sp.]HPC89294.1 RsmB/NOP family class I SAM-dependent RNA methyltransferase [Methanothrix sp.]HRT16831.1 RsmB/NOP family class I SAM-dependent RNA methyltransferase [Methanothrix sp.]
MPFSTCMDTLDRYREIIPDFEAFRAFQSLPLYSSARINTLKTGKKALLERLEEAGVPYQSFSWYPLGLKLDAESPGKLLESQLGYIHIQEELSMAPPLVLDPGPGEMVLDLCASPGSKTTQISQMMQNRGLVVANEPSLARLAALRSNCERLGVLNAAITRYDGRSFPRGGFDRVLVDAPCSSEGRERRGPGTLMRCSATRSRGLHVLQAGLLKSALRLVRPGGVVVYSTCTYAPEENELVVQAALEQSEASGGPGLRLERISLPGLRECPGITEWEGRSLSSEMARTARYYPHINDTGGFYIARIVKK